MSVEGVLKGGIEPLLERMFDVVFEEVPLAAADHEAARPPQVAGTFKCPYSP